MLGAMMRQRGARGAGLTLAASALALLAAAAHAQTFSATDLDRLLHAQRAGVIYLWSPHMPYSVRGAREAAAVAARLQLNLTLLLDPFADPRLAAQTGRSQGLPAAALRTVQAPALLARGATQHFPTVIVFRDGHLAPGMLPGYTPPDRLGAYLARELTADGAH